MKLKNGETITGVVVSKDNHYITIEVACGEMGFDESLVESIDATQGPRTKEDVATLTDAARKRAADADAERAMAVARREAAIQRPRHRPRGASPSPPPTRSPRKRLASRGPKMISSSGSTRPTMFCRASSTSVSARS